jgi:hypothetical protein
VGGKDEARPLVNTCGYVGKCLTHRVVAFYRDISGVVGDVVRKALAVLSAFSVGVAGAIPVPVVAQQTVAAAAVTAPARPIDPIVLETFKAYRAGGQALTERIRLLVLQNNYLSGDVARAITTKGLLNPAQRAAAEQGLADALTRLGAATAQQLPPAPTGGLDPSGPPAVPSGLVDQVPPAAADAGLSGGQWAALVGALAVGGGALGFGLYEVTKKVSPN